MPRVLAPAVMLAAVLGLAGCASLPVMTPFPGMPPSAGAAMRPASTVPVRATTTPNAQSAASAHAHPSVPQDARDVSAWPKSDFASPSGDTWCELTATGALCQFPKGYLGAVPDSEDVCPGKNLDVVGVEIKLADAEYFCGTATTAYPVKGRTQVRWHVPAKYPFVTVDKLTLAVLPHGAALRNGDFACSSAEAGVTCANAATGHGFRISVAGLEGF